MAKRLTIAILVAALGILFGSNVSADEYEDFIDAKNAYDTGNFDEAVKRFEETLNSELNNTALVLECHKFAGVSYLFIDDKEKAEHHFTELLNISPEYSLDSIIFPIEVIDFFTAIKRKNKERLAALAVAKAEEEAKRKAAEKDRCKIERENLLQNVYIERTTKQNSLIVAMLPLGAGQFQNQHKVKGVLFLTTELLLGATSITTYFLHESLRNKGPFESPTQQRKIEQQEKAFRVINQASIVTLGVVVVAGMFESLYHFQPQVVLWKKLDEDKVPKKLRKKKKAGPTASFTPQITPDWFGLSVSGSF